MATYFLVEYANGPAWDPGKPRREQLGWDDHAAFVDGLAEQGVVRLAGPVGDGADEYALVVASAASEPALRQRLEEDPWLGSILTIRSLKPWTIWGGSNAGSW